MAQFQDALAVTLRWEGGYSNNAADSGGETYEGISRNNFPNWGGWAIIDEGNYEGNQMLQGLVVTFYHDNFWQYDGINSQLVANKVFDLGVNVGTIHAIKITQGALQITVDGVYGPNTQDAINSTDSGSLLTTIKSSAEEYHKDIVITHPQDAIFLNGWLRRDVS